jgi:hypothetical protein
MPRQEIDDWAAYRKLVEDKFEQVKENTQNIADLKTEIALLKMKSGLWGFAAGALPIIAWMIAEYMRKQ